MESTNNSSGQYNTSGQTNTGSQAGGFNMGSLTDMLGGLNIQDAVKKYGGTATKAINNLTTTQKVLGGAALLLGATYLARKKGALGMLGKVGAMSKMGRKKNR